MYTGTIAGPREVDRFPCHESPVMTAKSAGVALLLAAAFSAGAAPVAAQTQGATATRPQAAAPAADTTIPALLRRAGLARARGVKEAPVTVFEVADFQCPFCAEFANVTFHRIDSAYIKPGKVQWVFVNMPLPMHPNAFQASEAAMCAGAVADRFWPMHERLYQSQPEWSGATDPHPIFQKYAREAGVPEAPYAACIRAERVWPVILQDATYAAASRIDGTPTYILGNQVVAVGAKTFDDWKTILDKAIQDAAAKKTQ